MVMLWCPSDARQQHPYAPQGANRSQLSDSEWSLPDNDGLHCSDPTPETSMNKPDASPCHAEPPLPVSTSPPQVPHSSFSIAPHSSSGGDESWEQHVCWWKSHGTTSCFSPASRMSDSVPPPTHTLPVRNEAQGLVWAGSHYFQHRGIPRDRKTRGKEWGTSTSYFTGTPPRLYSEKRSPCEAQVLNTSPIMPLVHGGVLNWGSTEHPYHVDALESSCKKEVASCPPAAPLPSTNTPDDGTSLNCISGEPRLVDDEMRRGTPLSLPPRRPSEERKSKAAIWVDLPPSPLSPYVPTHLESHRRRTPTRSMSPSSAQKHAQSPPNELSLARTGAPFTGHRTPVASPHYYCVARSPGKIMMHAATSTNTPLTSASVSFPEPNSNRNADTVTAPQNPRVIDDVGSVSSTSAEVTPQSIIDVGQQGFPCRPSGLLSTPVCAATGSGCAGTSILAGAPLSPISGLYDELWMQMRESLYDAGTTSTAKASAQSLLERYHFLTQREIRRLRLEVQQLRSNKRAPSPGSRVAAKVALSRMEEGRHALFPLVCHEEMTETATTSSSNRRQPNLNYDYRPNNLQLSPEGGPRASPTDVSASVECNTTCGSTTEHVPHSMEIPSVTSTTGPPSVTITEPPTSLPSPSVVDGDGTLERLMRAVLRARERAKAAEASE